PENSELEAIDPQHPVAAVGKVTELPDHDLAHWFTFALFSRVFRPHPEERRASDASRRTRAASCFETHCFAMLLSMRPTSLIAAAAVPHLQIEEVEVGGAHERANRRHHFGGIDRLVAERRKLLGAILGFGRVAPH